MIQCSRDQSGDHIIYGDEVMRNHTVHTAVVEAMDAIKIIVSEYKITEAMMIIMSEEIGDWHGENNKGNA